MVAGYTWFRQKTNNRGATMPRYMLSDLQWSTLQRIMLNTGRIYNKPEHRLTFEGILYRMRTGIPWRDLPTEFGEWSSVFRRFNLWSKKGVLTILFQSLAKLSDKEWLFIDGSIIKAHQDSAGAISTGDEAIGRSRGGRSTKIHLAVDSGGLPVHFELSGGQVHDIQHAESLVNNSAGAQVVTADKGYDSDGLRQLIHARGSTPNIPRKSNKKAGNAHMDWCLYRYRHLVENAFLKIKKYRAIATRYDKLARNYQALVALAFIMMWLPMHIE